MPPRRTALVAAVLTLAAAAGPAEAARVYGVTDENRLVTFDSSAPGTFLTGTPITGLGSETVRGLDVRAATNTLLLLTQTSGGALRFRTVDPFTGVTTSPSGTFGAPPTPSVGFAMDGDVARVATSAGDIATLNPGTGATLSSAPMTGSVPINALAVSGPGLLYGLDTSVDPGGLYEVDPSSGAANKLGDTTFFAPGSTSVQFDVAPDGEALVAMPTGLFRMSLASGGSIPVGAFSNGATLRGMAAVNNVFSLSATAADAAEGSPFAALTVVRAQPHDAASVQVALTGTSATAGQDFTGTTQTLTFAPGERSRVVQVPILDDGADEQAEQLTATITPVGGSRVADPRTATITIRDDDPTAAAATPPSAAPAPEVVLVPFPVGPPARVLAAGECANPLQGTSGGDALTGTPAGDLINGGAGADALAGRDGDDCLTGGAGNDWLNGAEGNDAIRGDSGEDFLLGGRGNDALAGGNGDDRLAGGDGDDTITAGGGSNHVVGGSGSDRINARNGRRDVIDCGGGRDRATIDIGRDKLRGSETIPGT